MKDNVYSAFMAVTKIIEGSRQLENGVKETRKMRKQSTALSIAIF
jgi:hypothetical protein